MKLTGPEAMPPPESGSWLPRSAEKLVPVPEPHLNSMPSVLVRFMMESMLSCTELMKHAEHCGLACTPTLNHTGELKAHLLLDQQVRQIVAESVASGVRGEVGAALAPADDGFDHAADQLAHGVLALGRIHFAVEIFRRHDVGGRLRPGLRHLDAFLAENHLAFFIADQRGAPLPFDRVEWRHPPVGEISAELQARFRTGLGRCVTAIGLLFVGDYFRLSHFASAREMGSRFAGTPLFYHADRSAAHRCVLSRPGPVPDRREIGNAKRHPGGRGEGAAARIGSFPRCLG